MGTVYGFAQRVRKLHVQALSPYVTLVLLLVFDTPFSAPRLHTEERLARPFSASCPEGWNEDKL